MKRSFLLVLAFAVVCLGAMTAQAQAQASRTWVSGVGDDANPCSRTAPCKTFAGAISKTADCGEIDALDPGGFGTITITKGITIDGGGGEAGQVASILAAGTPGITISNSSANCPFDVIRNLDIQGINSGTIGISVIAGGTLSLENVNIANFTQQCVNLAPASAVGFSAYFSNFEHCTGGGVVVNYTGAGVERVTLTGTKIHKSQGTGIGVSSTGNARISIRSCDIFQNVGGGVQSSGSNSWVQLFDSQVANNQVFGVHTTLNATMTLSNNSIIYNNGTGVMADGGSIMNTWMNNWVTGNSPDGARTGTITPI